MARRLARCGMLLLLGAAAAWSQTVQIRVLATTDLHGNIYPYDYFTARPAARGLARISTLVARERAANPNTILVDCGDTIQGATLEGVHQMAVREGRSEPDPMMLAMNRLGYAAMAVGNHEFNYGLKNLEAARREAEFPWLAANIDGGDFAGHVIKEMAGVKVAIIGVTTAAIPGWEKAENYAGLKFLDAPEAVRRELARIGRGKARPDVVVVLAHSGLDRDPRPGAAHAENLPGENQAVQIAQVPGVDAVIFGHTHSEFAEYRLGNVLLMQPRNWGMSLGEMDFTLEKTAAGFAIKSKTSRTIPVRNDTPADPEILALGKPYHEAAEKYLSQPVVTTSAELTTATARVEDNPLIDLIQQVQMAETHADVSFASAFSLGVRVGRGQMTVRQIAALYPYDNTLYLIEGNGKMVREALENSARFYLTCTGDCTQGPLINRNIIGYNYDMAQGVSYQVDLRKPAGQRIVNLSWHGQPLGDSQPLKIAVNNYRAGGSAGYTMFPSARILWRSSEEIREMLIRYLVAKGSLDEQPDGNWRVIPEAAYRELLRESRGESSRPNLQ